MSTVNGSLLLEKVATGVTGVMRWLNREQYNVARAEGERIHHSKIRKTKTEARRE